jgi:hypothetical protein
MVSWTIYSLAMVNVVINILTTLILAIIISFIFILAIINFYIVGLEIKYWFIRYVNHINFIHGYFNHF